jgi:ABC-2 type transport system permease protein
VEWLAWTQNLSPFFYYSGGRPLSNGLQTTDALILAGAALVLVAVAVFAFRRRDIAV